MTMQYLGSVSEQTKGSEIGGSEVLGLPNTRQAS